jgi:hypothetical protein
VQRAKKELTTHPTSCRIFAFYSKKKTCSSVIIETLVKIKTKNLGML